MCGWPVTHWVHAQMRRMDVMRTGWLTVPLRRKLANLPVSMQIVSITCLKQQQASSTTAKTSYSSSSWESLQTWSKRVMADAECRSLTMMLLGLALMFVNFTGPFWIFVRSDMHYLDQHRFIQPMHSLLKEMCRHPEMLFQEEEFLVNLTVFAS